MYSLELTCSAEDAELLAAELWEYGALSLWEQGSGLLVGFETDTMRNELLRRFAAYEPEWKEDETDWEAETKSAWPGREVGNRIFLAPPWCSSQTPAGRVRLVLNPGAASGTGEHPCTQLALAALEELVRPGCFVLDVGTGSGVLAIAAMALGASGHLAIDTDEDSLATASENFQLNHLPAALVAGGVDCLADACADLTVANISGTVILSILDDLVRITKPSASLVLTGFTEGESATFKKIFPRAKEMALNEWRCLTISDAPERPQFSGLPPEPGQTDRPSSEIVG